MATAPSITERPPRNFEPRSIAFPKNVQEEIGGWLHKQIEYLTKKYDIQYKNKIPELRRILDGKPKDENLSWPFPNCSNVVAQLSGEAVDELVAWVLQLIWITQPLCKFSYPSDKDETQAQQNSEKGKALGQFLDDAAYDPHQLNLYPYHNKWFTDSAGLGKAHICVAPERRMEAVYAGYGPNEKGKDGVEFEDSVLYEGPKLINLRYEDILVDDPDGPFEDNDPIVRRCELSKRRLQERVFKGYFDKAAVEKILGQPDFYGSNEIKKRENQRKGLTETEDENAKWVIYECYFSWYHNKKKFRLISWYHNRTQTTLNCVYNFIPRNQVPILETSLSVDKKGLAQMMKDYQTEVSTAKNQRADAITWGILGINTLDPQNLNIDRNFTITPGMALPVAADQFNHHSVAEAAMAGISLQNEEALIQQAKQRAGVGPPIMGTGAGSANKKGQFGSMGTLAVLQAGNSRDAHRTSGFRHSSVRLYSMLTDFYGMLDLDVPEIVRQALDDYLARKLRIPVRAADASMNKEVTKQNEIILNQAYAAYIKQTSSMLQAYSNPQLPPFYKKWLRSIIIGTTKMFQQVLKDFQLTDNPQEFCPDIDIPKEEETPNAQPQAGPGAGGNDPRLAAVAQLVRGRGASGGTGTQPGMDVAPPGFAGIPR